MEKVERLWIQSVLRKLEFVQWDRYYTFPKFGSLTVFGWIKREKDKYKDFVILEFTLLPNKNPSCVYFLGTSSAEYSERIANILGSEHAKCVRVEDTFDIPNSIEGKETKP